MARLVAAALLCAGTVIAHQIPLGGSKPTIDSKSLQDAIKADNLLKRAKELYKIAELGEEEYNHPTRVIGSKGHLGTIEYIYSTLAEFGDYYTLSNQSFDAVTGNVFESRLVIGHDVPKSAKPMGLTPATKDKEPVYGPLVLISNDGCEEADYPKNVTGAIAFVRRGTCPFGTKSLNAGKAGAVAAVVYNNEKGDVQGTLGEPSAFHVATFGISQEEAEPYIASIKNGTKLDSIAYIDAEVVEINTLNIIAQTSSGDPDNCVMVGGHSDSVDAGPGINDDGSGSLSLLEVASALTKFEVNNCVRFAWWAGEEEGLLGSNYYANSLSASENQKIRLFADYDMMGSPNYAYQIYNATNEENPVGSAELRVLYEDWYEEQGLNYTYIPFDGRSDYVGFIENGIPGGGIATGAEGIKTDEEVEMFGGVAGQWYDQCYHQLCDNVTNVDLGAWEINTKLIAHSVATYAKSFSGFPKREGIKTAAKKTLKNAKYRGSKLVI